MKNKYWYDPQTGEILHRTAGTMITFELPYLELEPFDWCNYTVDVSTLELVKNETPVPVNPRGR